MLAKVPRVARGNFFKISNIEKKCYPQGAHGFSQKMSAHLGFIVLHSKIEGNRSRGFLSHDRTNKQTNRDYNFIYRFHLI